MDGPGIAAVSIGIIFVYGGIKGYSPVKAFENIITGKHPNEGQSNASLIDSNISNGSGGPTGGGGSISANKTLAKQIAIAMGHADWITGQMWSDWDALWTQESGWSETAKNPQSGAYGIPQALPATKMASAGPDWQTNPATQIRWGIGYIASTYGNPSNAESHERQFGWY